MIFDQQVELFELRLHVVNVSEIVVPAKHVSAKSQSLNSSSAPLKAVAVFSRASSFATVTVLTAPELDLLSVSFSDKSRWTVSASPYISASICSGVIIAPATHQFPEYAVSHEFPTRRLSTKEFFQLRSAIMAECDRCHACCARCCGKVFETDITLGLRVMSW